MKTKSRKIIIIGPNCRAHTSLYTTMHKVDSSRNHHHHLLVLLMNIELFKVSLFSLNYYMCIKYI
jgi:hypothetical protein